MTVFVVNLTVFILNLTIFVLNMTGLLRTDWHIDWLSVSHWLTDWLTHWLTDWLTNWLTDWLYYLLTFWLNKWLTDANGMALWQFGLSLVVQEARLGGISLTQHILHIYSWQCPKAPLVVVLKLLPPIFLFHLVQSFRFFILIF